MVILALDTVMASPVSYRNSVGVSFARSEDSDSKRHADQELTALRIQILGKRRSDTAQAHREPEAARRLLERDEKEM